MITLPVTFDSATRRASKEVSLRFSSNLEISPEELMEMDRLIQTEGWLLFKPNAITLDDIPTLDAPSDTKKPSERLRDIIFIVWKSRGDDGDFDNYYRAQINKIITRYKDMLDEVH
jgi:hypothetical protein